MTDNSFDSFVKELEARAIPEERELLNNARERALSMLDSVKLRIARREHVEAFAARIKAEVAGVTLLQIEQNRGPFDHDGDCIIVYLDTGRHFTVLPVKGEVWGHHDGHADLTENPVFGRDDDEIIAYINDNRSYHG
jgi:hypothetical protein